MVYVYRGIRLSATALVLLGAQVGFSIAPITASAQAVPAVCQLPTTVEGSVSLTPGCSYAGSVQIKTSDVVLDCRGAEIDARGAKSGIVIFGRSLRNITIKNCHIDGADNEGILIRAPAGARDMEKLPMSERYAIASRDISILSSTITRSGTAGIYVGNYTQGAVIKDVTVQNSGSIGLYLDASTLGATVQSSTFIANGFGDVLGRRKEKRNREAIAIDSSAHNKISDNKFQGNSAGGILIYKNCWEQHDKPKQAPRWQHSSYNAISGNMFEEEIGIWVASRQAKNLKNMDCGDPPLAPGFYRDYADHNTISDNRFTGGEVGINVQDDFTTIKGNTFNGQTNSCLILGSSKRDDLLQQPIHGTALISNSCNVDGTNGFTPVGTSRFEQCEGNTFAGRPYECDR